jgi:hypothetical protein
MNAIEKTRLGGLYSETTAARYLLEQAGVVSAHNGQPLSEAMLFGISGGIGFMYFNFEYEGHPPTLYIGTAHRYKTKFGEMMDNLYQRLGVQTVVKKSASATAAEKNLRQALAQGSPVLLHVALGALPYVGTHEMYYDYAIVVTGYHEQENVYEVLDRSTQPLTLQPEALAAARAGIASLKNRSTTLRVPEQKSLDLREAILAGIRSCCDVMQNPPAPVNNFGFNGLEKWASLINDPKNKKGWSQVFATGADLFAGLYATYRYLETSTGSGAMRELYAEFLGEAAEVLHQPDLVKVAAQYREIARLWTELANAVLPDEQPLWKELKQLTVAKERLFKEKGIEAGAEIRQINERIREIAETTQTDFPYNPEQVRALLDDLHIRILRIVEAERQAMSELLTIVS